MTIEKQTLTKKSMPTILKKPEILAPGGTLEKLKMAIHYGADACYIGGEAYGLRSRAGNFNYEEMGEAVEFAHRHGAKVYVVANMITHQKDEIGAGDFFRTIRDIGVDAVLISDPALMDICVTDAPGLPIHLSTQASATNYETLNFWAQEGLERVVLAREVSMEEIKFMRDHVDVEIEAFVHGAMCISYSGRCVLSNHMSGRDANRGGCSQSCRWKYGLFEYEDNDEKYDHTRQSDIREKFAMSSVDLSMIEHIPDLIQSGIDSLKIEGRMKSIHYVSTVVNVYRKAVDSYCQDPENYQLQQEWVDELWKAAQRELATGFYYGTPTENEQLFGKPRRIPQYNFVGQVMDYDPQTQIATIQERNKFVVGDTLEFYGPGMRHFTQVVEKIWDEEGREIEEAIHPMMICKLKVDQPVEIFDMMRKQK